MAPESPPAVTRRAAVLLRDRAKFVPAGPWTHKANPPTTGHGPAVHSVHASPEPPYTVGVQLFLGEHYTRAAEVCQYIAALDPVAGLAVAVLLDAVAGEMADYGSVIETAEGVMVAPSHGFRYDVAPLWTAALAAARAVLGESS